MMKDTATSPMTFNTFCTYTFSIYTYSILVTMYLLYQKKRMNSNKYKDITGEGKVQL